MESNWQIQKDRSNYHFDWLKQESVGYHATWVGRFEGDWDEELKTIIAESEPKTMRSRGKNFHPDDPGIESEEYDLEQAGMSADQVIFRKNWSIEGKFKKMTDYLGLVDTKGAFHIQYPGEMLNLHIDKHAELGDPEKVVRFIIFLEDWKPGQVFMMGNEFLRWRKGDIYWFDWLNIPHATANCGWEPRASITWTGTMTLKTINIMKPTHEPIKV